MQFGPRMGVCVHAISVTDNYTSFSHSNKQVMLSPYSQNYFKLHMFDNYNHNLHC